MTILQNLENNLCHIDKRNQARRKLKEISEIELVSKNRLLGMRSELKLDNLIMNNWIDANNRNRKKAMDGQI